jgi:cobalt-zinc-cadmium efflux system protein
MGWGHDQHRHSHGSSDHKIHDHAVAFNRAFLVGIVLNLSFVVAEIAAGYWANSVSLLADAGHNFSDVVALLLSWLGYRLNQSVARESYSFGFKKVSLIIGFFNALILCMAVLLLALEAYERLLQPEPARIGVMIAVASMGVIINLASAFLFRSHGHDINLRGAYLHLMADALISVGVVAGALLMHFTGLQLIDAFVAMVISAIILWGGFRLLKDSFLLIIGKVPAHIQLPQVREFILAYHSDIASIHFLKIWALSSSETHLICHVQMKSKLHPGNMFLHDLAHALQEKFSIQQATIQIEINDGARACHA